MMYEYEIVLNTEEKLQEAKSIFRAMEMKLPIKMLGRWWAVKCVETKRYGYDRTKTWEDGFIPLAPKVLIAAMTPYHTKTR